jgi:hypothetical protein
MNRSTRFVALAALLLCAAPVFAEGPLRFFPITPCRLADTRQVGGPIPGQTSRDFDVQGVCGVPTNAKAIALNATIIGPQTDGYLTLYPSGIAKPALGNGAIVALSTNDKDLTAYVFLGNPPGSWTSHLALDATGYFCKVDAGGACIP